MPRIEVTTTVNVSAKVAFELSQTQGEVRYAWDPFIREQRLLGGATRAAKGVQTFTRSRHGLKMVSVYVSYQAPNHVGMKMVTGPPFFSTFSGGWNFRELGENETEATWRYNFTIRPKFIRPIANWLGTRILLHDISKRLQHFERACRNPEILEQLKTQ